MQPLGKIETLTRQRVEEQRRSPGLVVGVLTPEGRTVFTAGVREAGLGQPVQRDTLFEIGSITKVFTALLLADASLRGELNLDAPINDFLPAGFRAPAFDGQEITLTDLATHGSGLPSFMDGSPPFDDSWASYDREAMLADVAAYSLTRPIGSAYRYSNTGYGLLGIALEAATGQRFEPLLRERVLAPLGLESTAMALTPALEARTASPHGYDQRPGVQRIGIVAMASAGALWSSVDDLLSFLAAAAGLVETPLAPAFAEMLKVRRRGPPAAADGFETEQALGWPVIKTPGGPILAHAGGTVGMGCIAMLDLAGHEGVVVLGNSALGHGEFATHLLRPERPVVEQPVAAPLQTIALDRSQLHRLPGRYALGPGAEFLVEVDAKGVICRPPDGPRLRLQPFGDLQFFNPAYGMQVAFELPDEGPASALVITANGAPHTAARTS